LREVYLLSRLKLVFDWLKVARVVLGRNASVGCEDHVAVDDFVGDGAVVGPLDVGQDVARELLAGEGLVEPALVIVRLQVYHQHVELLAERTDEGVVALGFHSRDVGEDGVRVDADARRVAPVEVDKQLKLSPLALISTSLHLASRSVSVRVNLAPATGRVRKSWWMASLT
jgi:hypothetical protein